MAPRALLIGLPGTGKSTTGRRLAKILTVPFADSDEVVEAATTRTVAEIFETDARFQSQSQRLENIDHVYGFLSDVIGTRTTAYWLEVFDKADIPAARMYAIQDILADEHVRATGFVRKVDHPTQGELQITAIPTEWSESVPENRLHAQKAILAWSLS